MTSQAPKSWGYVCCQTAKHRTLKPCGGKDRGQVRKGGWVLPHRECKLTEQKPPSWGHGWSTSVHWPFWPQVPTRARSYGSCTTTLGEDSLERGSGQPQQVSLGLFFRRTAGFMQADSPRHCLLEQLIQISQQCQALSRTRTDL